MKPALRLLGWLLLGIGVVVGGLTLLTRGGVAPFGINLLGPSAFTASGRQALIAGGVFLVVLSAVVLRVARRDFSKRRGG